MKFYFRKTFAGPPAIIMWNDRHRAAIIYISAEDDLALTHAPSEQAQTQWMREIIADAGFRGFDAG